MQGDSTDRALDQLISDLFQNQVRLIRQQIELSKLETGVNAVKTFKGLLLVAAGGGLLLSVFIMLLEGIVVALSIRFPPVIAILAASLLVGCAGLLVLGSGIYMISKSDFTPGRAVEGAEQSLELAGEETP